MREPDVAPGPERRNGTIARRFVTCKVGGSRYGIALDEVAQIIRTEGIMEVPKAPPFVRGVVNLKGEIVPVIGMRERLGMPPKEAPTKQRIIVTKQEHRSYGLLVDEVQEIVELPDEAIDVEASILFGQEAECVQGIAHGEQQALLILSLPKTIGAGSEAISDAGGG